MNRRTDQFGEDGYEDGCRGDVARERRYGNGNRAEDENDDPRRHLGEAAQHLADAVRQARHLPRQMNQTINHKTLSEFYYIRR